MRPDESVCRMPDPKIGGKEDVRSVPGTKGLGRGPVALLQVARVMAESLNPDEVCQRIAHSVLALVGTQGAAVYQLEPESGDLVAVAAAGDQGPGVGRHFVLPRGTGLVGLAVRERRPVVTSDLLGDPRITLTSEVRRRIEQSPLRAGLAVPLLIKERVIGALGVGDGPGRQFSAEEIGLVQSFADQAALALENARLYEEAERRRREAEVLAELARKINASLDLDTVLQRLAEGARELCGSHLAQIALRDPASGAMVTRYWPGAEHGYDRVLRVEPGKGLGGQVLLTGRPFRTDYYAADPRITKDYLGVVGAEGVVTELAVPILIEGRAEGLLYVSNRSPKLFSDRDEATLLRLADQAAIAIRNAQLFIGERAARADAEASSQRFLSIVQDLDAIVWEADATTLKFSFVSHGGETILGYPIERWFTDPDLLARLVHPDDHERVVSLRRAAIARGHDYGVEYRALTADGWLVWLRDQVHVLSDAEGRVHQLRGLTTNITDRKSAEEALRESEGRYRIVAETATDAIITIDEESRICFTNPATERIFGYTVDEMVGQPLTKLMPERLRAAHRAAVGRYLETGRPNVSWRAVELPGLHKSGREVPLEISFGESLRNGSRLFIGIVRDITDRKRAEEALRRSEASYRSLIQGAVCGIYRSSVDGRFLEVNPALVAMLGYDSAAELMEVDLATAIYRNAGARARVVEELRRTGRFEGVEVEWRRKDSTPITVQLSGRVVRDASGAVTSFEAIAENVTERRLLEEQLRQSQKIEAVGRLAGGVAHDFNNLLTVIGGRSQLVLDRLPPIDPLRRDIELIQKTSERAASLTRQLLAFSRKQVLQPRVLNVNGIVAELGPMLRRLIGEDIDLVTTLDPALKPVSADPTQLEQVIVNLAVNARDAMPRGGRLSIETANAEIDVALARRHSGVHPGPHVALAVSDTGCGMDPDTQAHLFEPFFTTKGPGRGTGLGLATVYGVVKQHRGLILVESGPGHGATFRIYLPAVRGTTSSGEAGQTHSAESWGSETVLLVEDEEEVRALAREILQERGYEVLQAASGRTALEVSDRHEGRIHLLVTDVVMPEMSGYDLAERLTALRREMKVLYVSGYADETIARHGVLDPGTALLQKPFVAAALVEKVREILDGVRPDRSGEGSG